VWGSSEHGQLGIGSLSAEDRAVQPRLIEGLRSTHVRHVACAGHYSCAVAESGDVYTWGHGKDGQLGHGDCKDVYAPKAVRGLQSKLIRHVSCAEHHAAAVSETGVLFTWGRGQNGRLGHGGSNNELFPKVVESLGGHHVVQVSCGDFHTSCAILNPMQVLTWGLGLSGRLGHGDEVDCLVPTSVEPLSGLQVACVACGGHHTAAIVEPSGHLMSWGGGAFGKLGMGNRLAQTSPKLVIGLQGKKLVQVSLGPHHTAALTHKGEVFTWGQAGRLGHASQGAEVDEMVPRQVAALANVFVVQVSCGHGHCAAVTETGDVWAWGASRAFGHTEPAALPNVPTMIKVLSGKAIVQVACAVTHNLALSDYRRLAGKAALAAARSTGAAGVAKDRAAALGAPAGARSDALEDPGGPHAKRGGDAADGAPGPADDRGGAELPEATRQVLKGAAVPEGSPEKGHIVGRGTMPAPSTEREVAFLSSELKSYQEQALRLARQLQEAKTKLEALQNENSFLKSELEVMHKCSNDGDERLDTLRRHFNERLREMERRYAEKERTWREAFGRLRSQFEVGASDLDSTGAGGGEGAAAGPAHADPAALGEAAAAALSEDAPSLGPASAADAPAAAAIDLGATRTAEAQAAAAPQPPRARASGSISALFPGRAGPQ